MDKEYFLENKNGSRLKPKSLKNENPLLYSKIIEYSIKYSLNVPFKEMVFLYVNNLTEVPKCKECGNDVGFQRFSLGYRDYCSLKCKSSSTDIKDKIKSTFLEKYGGHPLQNEDIKNKIKSTNTQKYGHESHLSSKEIKNKIESTNIQKYGVKRPLESKLILDKTKQKMLELYGVEYGLQSKEIYEKTLKNRNESINWHEFYEKIKSTKNKKYGNSFYNNIEKNKKTCLEKYNTDNILKLKSIREKISDTKLFNSIKKYKHGSKILLLDYNKENCVIECKECGYECEINRHFLTMRGNNDIVICLKCNPYGNIYSSSEKEVEFFLKNEEYIKNERKILEGLELDFYLPKHNLAIEYNGLYWHSEIFKDKNYHLNKTNECKDKGIELIHIFEDEWIHKSEIVKSIINSRLKINTLKVYARNCEIREVDTKQSKLFLDNNHIQGKINSKVSLGLYYKDELISLMTFGPKRISLGSKSKNNEWELLRFCNKINTSVIGAASKLFKFFIKKYNPKKILSYSDNRYFNGNLYDKLGFDFVSNTVPNYYYVIKNKKYHRYNFRKDKLVKDGYDINKTEKEIMLERKIYRIYDCGNKKWLWEKKYE
jgi:hypothetical protein